MVLLNAEIPVEQLLRIEDPAQQIYQLLNGPVSQYQLCSMTD